MKNNLHKTDPNRLSNGHFAAGNNIAMNRPDTIEVRLVREFRHRLLKSITMEQAESIMRSLLSSAVEDRDVPAAKELLNRLVGPPVALDVFDRVSRLEEAIDTLKNQLGIQCDTHDGVGVQKELARLFAPNDKGEKNVE